MSLEPDDAKITIKTWWVGARAAYHIPAKQGEWNDFFEAAFPEKRPQKGLMLRRIVVW
jgi:hypothetical protein